MMQSTDPVELTRTWLTYPTVSTRSNAALSEHLGEHLARLGFELERLRYVRDDVEKVCVVGKRGTGTGGLAYFGHTDVVPAENWTGPGGDPFTGVVEKDRLFGRGACDMKGSIACLLAACARRDLSRLRRPLYVVLTADEETGQYGAAKVAESSAWYREMVAQGTCGIVGEPTSLRVVHGHKGTCLFRAVARGRAAHSGGTAGQNANLQLIPFLADLRKLHDELELDPRWHDEQFHPPTLRPNIGINDHNPAVNITAERAECTVFFRPMPRQPAEPVIQRLADLAVAHGLAWEVCRQEAPYFHDPSSDFVRTARKLADSPPSTTIHFGTDASRLGELKNLVILGPGHIAQAHTSDEYIDLSQLELGTEIYGRFIDYWCGNHGR